MMRTYERVYIYEECGLVGYTEKPGVHVLANASESDFKVWWSGGLRACDECPTQFTDGTSTFCADCQQQRSLFADGIRLFFRDEFGATNEQILATFEDGNMPVELIHWIIGLPGRVRARRIEELEKN